MSVQSSESPVVHLGSSGLVSGGIIMLNNNHVILRHVKYFRECFDSLHIPRKCHYSNCPEEKAELLMGGKTRTRLTESGSELMHFLCVYLP